MLMFTVTMFKQELLFDRTVQAEDVQSSKRYALKAESNAAAGGTVLKQEVLVLKRLAGTKHFAELIASGKRPQYSYMVS